MKKNFLALSLVAVMVFLAGCSSTTKPITPPVAEQPDPVATPTPDVVPPVVAPVAEPVAPAIDTQTDPAADPAPEAVAPVTDSASAIPADPVKTTPKKAPIPKPVIQYVTIKSFSFNPASLTIKVGDTVKWTNQDGAPHTIASASFNSSSLQKGNSYSFKFTKAGTYSYICSIHPSMKGTIIVK